MMAETGQDKKTVIKTLIGQKYAELESSVGITWESLGATVEEALAAVRAEAAVGEDEDDTEDGAESDSQEEDRLLIEEIIEDEKKDHVVPLLDGKYKEALEAGMTPQQIEDKLLPMLEDFSPKIDEMMAETGQDKKTVIKTLIGEKYAELESSVGITWDSLRAIEEEAVAAVRFEAAVGLTDDEKKAVTDESEESSESAEDLALIHLMVEQEKKEHKAPVLDRRFEEYKQKTGKTEAEVEQDMAGLLKSFRPQIKEIMASTGKDKRTVIEEMAAERMGKDKIQAKGDSNDESMMRAYNADTQSNSGHGLVINGLALVGFCTVMYGFLQNVKNEW